MLRTALRRLRARAEAPGAAQEQDAGAALLTVVLLMFIVLALATLVLGAVVSQVGPTRATQQSTRVVFAAETGLQTTLAQLRTSTGGTGVGQLSSLPCSVTGTVPGGTGGLSFTSRVRYYTQDPSGKDTAWLTANAVACVEGAGVTVQPAFALISVSGNDSSTGAVVRSRSLLAQYAFRVSNENVSGGLLYTAGRSACLQAVSATAGATVTYVAASSCSSSRDDQSWAYDTGYHLVLVSTVTTTTTGTPPTTTTSGLCLTQPDLSATDRTVTLQPCTLASRGPMQLWSYEGGGRFRGQNAGNTDFGQNCLWSGQFGNGISVVGRVLVAGGSGTCDSNNADFGSFVPEPRVGAGAASLATSQVVNYQQFGRCMDVTFEDVNQPRMIVYPCKQDPSGGSRLFWNHRWYYGAESGVRSEPSGPEPMSTRLRVFQDNDPGRVYCLTTPSSAVTPAYVALHACDGSAAQQFTRTYATGELATSYTFRTSGGRCLSLGPAMDVGFDVSTIVADDCTGGPEQKWNAPPTALDSRVTRQLETSVGS